MAENKPLNNKKGGESPGAQKKKNVSFQGMFNEGDM